MTSMRWPTEGQHWAISDTKARRERIAVAAMQGLLASLGGRTRPDYTADDLAHDALACADALIVGLDKGRSDGE